MGKRIVSAAAMVLILTVSQALLVPIGLTVVFAQPALAKSDKNSKVSDWFDRYDQIRRQAQMSPAEKERSRTLMTQGLMANLVQSPDGAQEKRDANILLTKLINRYARASAQMADLPKIAETKKLHQGYSLYFHDAGALFADYLKVQNSLFATGADGNSLMGELAPRKANLEALDAANKELDAKLRAYFNISSYVY